MANNVNDADSHPQYATRELRTRRGNEASPRHPEAFRLPRQGERDPFWGLSRAWFYEAEKAGFLKLIRLRKRGNLRGVTLVPYQAVADLVHKAAGGARSIPS